MVLCYFEIKKYYRNATSFRHKWEAIRKGRISDPMKAGLLHLGLIETGNYLWQDSEESIWTWKEARDRRPEKIEC